MLHLQSSCNAQAGTNPTSSVPLHVPPELEILEASGCFPCLQVLSQASSSGFGASREHQLPNAWKHSLTCPLHYSSSFPVFKIDPKGTWAGRRQVEYFCEVLEGVLKSRKICLLMASISNLVLTALAAFQRLETLLEIKEPPLAQAVRSNLSRFKIWAGSLGAHRPYGHRSLEYRLSGATAIRTHVVELLEEMCGYLTDGRSTLATETFFSQF